MSKKIQDIIAKANKFNGEVNEATKRIIFNKPFKIKTRADALAVLSLMLNDNYTCELDEPLKALYGFIKKLEGGK